MVDKEVILPFLLLQNAVELDQHSRVDPNLLNWFFAFLRVQSSVVILAEDNILLRAEHALIYNIIILPYN